jgi:hypothetical protein
MCLARQGVLTSFDDADDDDDDDDEEDDESSSSSMDDDDDEDMIRIAHDAPRGPLGPVINCDNEGTFRSSSGNYLCSNPNCPQSVILLQGFSVSPSYHYDNPYMWCRICGHSMWIPTGRHDVPDSSSSPSSIRIADGVPVVPHGPVHDSASAQYLCSNPQCPQRVNLLQGFVVSHSYDADRSFMFCRACGFSMWLLRGRHDVPESPPPPTDEGRWIIP